MRLNPFSISGGLLTACALAYLAFSGSTTPRAEAASEDSRFDSFRLKVTWKGPDGEEKSLKSWSMAELLELERHESYEEVPGEPGRTRWRGLRVAKLIEKAIDPLPLNEKATIDLIVLRGAAGRTAFVPRGFLNRYPVFLAYWRKREKVGEKGPLFSVVPWSSKPKVRQEPLPLETFFVPNVTEVELTSFSRGYASVRLKRRSDPLAMRGEKLFIQTCMGCHAEKSWPEVEEVARRIRNQGLKPDVHRTLQGMPGLSERQKEVLERYFRSVKDPSQVNLARTGASS